MNEDVLRVYFDPGEIGPDGYPYAWNRPTPPTVLLHEPAARPPVKDLIRSQAGNRCERCGHPYERGMGEWSACDERCTHHGPIRYRDSHLGDRDEWRRRDVIPTTAAEARLDELPHGTGVRWDIEAQWRILTVHHLNGVKHDLRWWNLAALCQRCHLTIQAKVRLERPYDRPHTEWFRPHAAGYYASVIAEETGEPEPSRELVLASIDELLAIHATQGTLLA